MSYYLWKSNTDTCKPFKLNSLQNVKNRKIEVQQNDHSYYEKQQDVLNSECPRCKKKVFLQVSYDPPFEI